MVAHERPTRAARTLFRADKPKLFIWRSCNYDSMVCTRYIHFIPIPKTASESTRTFFNAEKCTIRPGTHKMNTIDVLNRRALNRRALLRRDKSANASIVRVATLRNPYARFLSTFFALQTEMKSKQISHVNHRYNDIFDSSMTVLELLRNEKSMQRLLGGFGAGHFLPMRSFVQGSFGSLESHSNRQSKKQIEAKGTMCWGVDVLLHFDDLKNSVPFMYKKIMGHESMHSVLPRMNQLGHSGNTSQSRYVMSVSEISLFNAYYWKDVILYEELMKNVHGSCKRGDDEKIVYWECVRGC